MNQQSLSAFIWSVADLLRGDYKQSDYGKVILPFTVLRRLVEQADPASRNDAINAIPQIYARVTDKSAALQVVREIQQRAKAEAEGLMGGGGGGERADTTTDAPARQAPKVGTVSRGYTYIGGDPSSPSSWRKQ